VREVHRVRNYMRWDMKNMVGEIGELVK